MSSTARVGVSNRWDERIQRRATGRGISAWHQLVRSELLRRAATKGSRSRAGRLRSDQCGSRWCGRIWQAIAATAMVAALFAAAAFAGEGSCTFTQVTGLGWHTCGLRPDGSVVCWGWNDYDQATPPGGSFTQVSAGGAHTCGLRSDRSVECWGWNDSGQATPPGGSFTQVSAGYFHTCGLRPDNSVVCWGLNDSGQATPPGGRFTQVSAGGVTCGLRYDGSVVCRAVVGKVFLVSRGCPTSRDEDRDGLPDDWERQYFGHLRWRDGATRTTMASQTSRNIRTAPTQLRRIWSSKT